MRFGKRLISKRTFALACAAIVLFTFGGVMGVRAAKGAPDIQSGNLEADFQLDELKVHLMENGEWAGARSDRDSGTGLVLSEMYADKTADHGTFVPGKKYREEIYAHNATGYDQYVRIILHKYWLNSDGSTKDLTLDPGLIKLSFGKGDYNSGSWIKSTREHTTESDTYYYKSVVKDGGDTALLVDKVWVDGNIVKDMTEEKEGNTITYKYAYDGKYVALEADVQAVQTHNANDAIKGIWGVQNVTVSGGTLSVSQ